MLEIYIEHNAENGTTSDLIQVIRIESSLNNIKFLESIDKGFNLQSCRSDILKYGNLEVWVWYRSKKYPISEELVFSFIERSCMKDLFINLQWLNDEKLFPEFSEFGIRYEEMLIVSLKFHSQNCANFLLDKYPKLRPTNFGMEFRKIILDLSLFGHVDLLKFINEKSLLSDYLSSLSETDKYLFISECLENSIKRTKLKSIDFWLEICPSKLTKSLINDVLNLAKDLTQYDNYYLLLKWCSDKAEKLLTA